MGTLKSALSLMLLLALPAAKARAEDADPMAGEVKLDLSPLLVSALPIDIGARAEAGCPGGDPWSAPPTGECRLTLTGGTGSLRQVAADAVSIDGPSAFAVLSWGVVALGAAAAPGSVESSCGPWDVSLSLDAGEQPLSPLVLKQAAGDAGGGRFASALEMRVRLHLSNAITGRDIEERLDLALGLAGSWTLAPAGEPASPPKSRLHLLDDGGVHCFPVWVIEVDEALEPFLLGDCTWCLQAGSPGS